MSCQYRTWGSQFENSDIWGLACLVHMEAGTGTWNIHDIWGLSCLMHMEAGTGTWNIHDI